MSKVLERILRDDLTVLSDYQNKIKFNTNTIILSGKTIVEVQIENFCEEVKKLFETKIVEVLKEYNLEQNKNYDMDWVFINRNPILRIYLT